MALWLIRAGKQGQDENLALEKGLAIIGWQDVPVLTSVKSRGQMRELCEHIYPDASKNKISNFTGQLWGFKGRIEIEDIVALPLKTRAAIALGKITGPYEYRDGRHTRKVKWIREDIPRSDFGQDLLYSLGAFMTVCQITRANAEERAREILEGKPDPELKKKTFDKTEVGESEEVEPPLDIEEFAQDQIRSYISTNFKGHELTALVNTVLKAQGYQSHVSPPGPDVGVDIIAGRGPMGFDRPRLCVQVKSSSTPVGASVLRELQGVMKNFGAEQGLLVSWGGFTGAVYKEARTLFFDIRLWDADRLVEAVLENYERLSEEIQAELPLKRVWTLVQEE